MPHCKVAVLVGHTDEKLFPCHGRHESSSDPGILLRPVCRGPESPCLRGADLVKRLSSGAMFEILNHRRSQSRAQRGRTSQHWASLLSAAGRQIPRSACGLGWSALLIRSMSAPRSRSARPASFGVAGWADPPSLIIARWISAIMAALGPTKSESLNVLRESLSFQRWSGPL